MDGILEINPFLNNTNGQGPPGPPGLNGNGIQDITSQQATGSNVVELNFFYTNGNSSQVSFTTDVFVTGGTFADIHCDELSVQTSANFQSATVTVTEINGVDFDTLASTVVTLDFTVNQNIDQPVLTTSSPTFDELTLSHLEANTAHIGQLTVDLLINDNSINLLVEDKNIIAGAQLETGSTADWFGSYTGSNNGHIGWAVGTMTSAGMKLQDEGVVFENLDYINFDLFNIYKYDSLPANFDSAGLNICPGNLSPVNNPKIYIPNPSGGCLYFSTRTSSVDTDLICFDKDGYITTKGRIGVSSDTTEWNPSALIQVKDTAQADVKFTVNSATHDADALLTSSGFDLRTSTSTPIRFRPYTNSGTSKQITISPIGNLGLNTSPDNAFIFDVNQGALVSRFYSDSTQSRIALQSYVGAANNLSYITQRSGTSNRELQFYNSTDVLTNPSDTLYSFMSPATAAECIRIKNSYTNFIGQSLGVGPTNFTPGYALEMRGAGPSIYLNGTSSGNCGIIIKTSGAPSNCQYYCDSSGVGYLSNFSSNQPLVFQTSPSGSSGNAFRVEANSRRDVLVGLNSIPTAPGSYSYANGSFAVAGDMWLGSASNVYRSLITGGGNSSGALFGNYSVQGDGLNLSYNFLVDSTNTPRYPNTGAGSSNLIMSFEQIKFQTGGISTLPTTKMYIFGSRVAIGKGENQADAALEVKTVSTEDILRLTNSSSINYWRFINDGTLGNYNPSGVLGFYLEQVGTSKEYTNILMNGYLYIYPHVQVGSTTPLVAIPADSGESMRLNGINLHVGSSSNTDSGFAFQTTGKAKITQGLIINSSAGDNDTQIQGDTDANLFYADASTDRIGVGTNSPSKKFHVVGDARIQGNQEVLGDLSCTGTIATDGLYVTDTNIAVTLGGAPASASATGTVGDIKFDTNYMYVCTATNSWKRVALVSW